MRVRRKAPEPGSISSSDSSVASATHNEPRPNASAERRLPPSGILCVTVPVPGSMRTALPPGTLAVHTDPPPTAITPGVPPTGIRSATVCRARSIRWTMPSLGWAAQAEPYPNAIAVGGLSRLIAARCTAAFLSSRMTPAEDPRDRRFPDPAAGRPRRRSTRRARRQPRRGSSTGVGARRVAPGERAGGSSAASRVRITRTGGSSAGSCVSIARSSSCSDRPGSSPSSSASRCRAAR